MYTLKLSHPKKNFINRRYFMDIRYSCSPNDVKRYTTDELRREFLITGLYVPDKVTAVYSHVDRMVTVGIMPVSRKLSIDDGIDVWKNFGTHYFLERREAGIFNLGSNGTIEADGKTYELCYKDCLYITKGTEKVFFSSKDSSQPAKFYMVSAPAHTSYETRLIRIADAAKRPVGDPATSNKRTINQFIHPNVLKTCQLSMGLTELESGSVWNTMPAHTHERRMEIYTYFEIPEGNIVFHFMGQGQETRHIVMNNFDAVISPSWSIHAGAGTSNYSFIWAMGGENQEFDDMDTIPPCEMK
jgi:4-deoxy-L-threo-5-hexosulose-uronate ketol-isomerase